MFCFTDLAKLNTLCPVPCCNGYGHYKWYKYRTHSRKKDCPYSKYNYDLERVENLDRFADMIVSDSEGDDMSENNFYTFEFGIDSDMIKCEAKLQEKIHPYYLKLIKENYLEMKRTLKTNNVHTLRYLMDYVKSLDFNPFDIVGFECQKMYEVIEKLTNSSETANIFFQEV